MNEILKQVLEHYKRKGVFDAPFFNEDGRIDIKKYYEFIEELEKIDHKIQLYRIYLAENKKLKAFADKYYKEIGYKSPDALLGTIYRLGYNTKRNEYSKYKKKKKTLEYMEEFTGKSIEEITKELER